MAPPLMLSLLVISFHDAMGDQEIRMKGGGGGNLVWRAEAESTRGESHSWDVSYVACQRRETIEHILSATVVEWKELPYGDVADCRRLCRTKRFTFAVLDGARCYCSKKYSQEEVLEKNHCRAPCEEAVGRRKEKTTSSDFFLKLEENENRMKYYEEEFAWNKNFCGKSSFLITFSVCPQYLYWASCDHTCMCESGYCDIYTGLCLGSKCLPGFGGPRCNSYDLCHDNPCENGGLCHSTEGSDVYLCKCKYGFYGENCEKTTNAEEVINEGLIEVHPSDVSDIWRGGNILSAAFFPIVSHLGCFKLPVGKSHSFSDTFLLQTNLMSIEMCLKHCTMNNYTLAALLKGNQCRCGHRHDTFVMVDQSLCPQPCSGKKQQLCVCPRMFYGLKTCDHKCRCESAFPCHIVTGRCPGNCAVGYEGGKCDIRSWSREYFLTLEGAYVILCILFIPLIFIGLCVVAGTYFIVMDPL